MTEGEVPPVEAKMEDAGQAPGKLQGLPRVASRKLNSRRLHSGL